MFNFDGLTEEQKEQIKEEEAKIKHNRELLKELAKKGKLPTARAMTRSERKALDATGCNIAKIKEDDPRSYPIIRDEMFDWILDNIYADFDFSAVDNNICNALALYTYQLTYQDDLAAKNS